MADPPRLTYTFPIKQFAQVRPDEIVLAFNALVNDINAALAALGANSAGFTTQRQMRLALVSQGQMLAVENSIPGDITDPVNIQWTSGSTVATGDTLYVAIQAATGYSNAQMAALMALALTYPA